MIRPRRKPRRGPARDAAYLAWIRGMPCLVCRYYAEPQWYVTEVHHYGPHGISQKASDYEAIPLCCEHHRMASDSVHMLGYNFGSHHRLDIEAEIHRLNEQWRAMGNEIAV